MLTEYIKIPVELNDLFSTNGIADWLDQINKFINSHDVDALGNWIHEEAYVSDKAIVRNSYIGKACEIHDFVNIRESIVLNKTVVGHCSEVVRSVVLNSCSIPRFNYIGSSLIGNNVRFGGVCSLASRRFDSKEVFVPQKGENIETGKPKFGSIVGDNTIVGFGAHFNPGTLIGMNCIIMPHVELKGIIPPDSIVSNRQKLVIVKKKDVSGLGLNNLER